MIQTIINTLVGIVFILLIAFVINGDDNNHFHKS